MYLDIVKFQKEFPSSYLNKVLLKKDKLSERFLETGLTKEHSLDLKGTNTETLWSWSKPVGILRSLHWNAN